MVGAVLLAGGKGERTGLSLPKQFHKVEGKELVLYSLEMLQKVSSITSVVVVSDEAFHPLFPQGVRFAKPGYRRQDSVLSGLLQLKGNPPYVLVHDSARPLIDSDTIEEVIYWGMKEGAAVLGSSVSSTIKRVNSKGYIEETLDRSALFEAQTPQVMKRELLLQALSLAKGEKTDCSSFLEGICPIKVVLTDKPNLKVTTRFDVTLIERILCER